MPATPSNVTATTVGGVTIHRVNLMADGRGSLAAGEFGIDIPFSPKRYFLVYGVPAGQVRGEHAHRTCAQFLVCVHGSVSVTVDDGTRSEEIALSSPTEGVLVPPMVWAAQHSYSHDAVLLVFASEHYDAEEYIRDYAKFKTAVTRRD